jgi:hypothetical protein
LLKVFAVPSASGRGRNGTFLKCGAGLFVLERSDEMTGKRRKHAISVILSGHSYRKIDGVGK